MTAGKELPPRAGSAVAQLRALLAADGADGLFIKLSSTETLEIAARNFDFGVVDLEHSLLGEADALRLLRHAYTLRFPALLRLPDIDSALIGRALEAGAIGIQLSNVQRADQIRQARQAMQFPPTGARSVSTTHPAADFGAMPLRGYVESAEPGLLVAQIETATTEDPLASIVAAGVDVVFVGTSDLAVDVSFDTAQTQARMAEIAKATEAADVPLGSFGTHSQSRYRLSCSDLSLFADATRRPRTASLPGRAVAARWPDIPDEEVRPGIRRRGFGNAACILVLNTCEPGMELRPHQHDFEQIALILSGKGRYHVGGVAHTVGPGSVLLIPAGVSHHIEPGDELIENLDVFAPARADYRHLLDWMAAPVHPPAGAPTSDQPTPGGSS